MIREPEHVWIKPGVRYLPDVNEYPPVNGHDRPDHDNDLIRAALPAIDREVSHDMRREGRHLPKLHLAED